ncbi:hypothetical protein [Streptomyces atratus]|uniref:hypothetical protein n=1 Tax=Streptomyces atratus TaxID=1893 RepID=UPI0033D9C396
MGSRTATSGGSAERCADRTAVIGIDMISELGVFANTSVVGALVAMLIGRIPLSFIRTEPCRPFRI